MVWPERGDHLDGECCIAGNVLWCYMDSLVLEQLPDDMVDGGLRLDAARDEHLGRYVLGKVVPKLESCSARFEGPLDGSRSVRDLLSSFLYAGEDILQ